MNNLYIIAEVAQGYEGSVDVCKMLIRSAKAANADAVKFQIVYADDFAVPGYEYYELFKTLEMSADQWGQVREFCRQQGLDFIVDIFGSKSLSVAQMIKPSGVKLHSTSFFDQSLSDGATKLDAHLFLSIGGIEIEEVESFLQKYQLRDRKNFTLLYGFQSEPTPVELNNLRRIPALRERLKIDQIGFMDHSDGGGRLNISLSALALGLGVTTFEKHITLDRALAMEDFVSALGVAQFVDYVSDLRALKSALGSTALTLTEREIAYRGKALKRVIAARDISPGETISAKDVLLSRPVISKGFFKIEEVVGRRSQSGLKKFEAVTPESIKNEK